MSERHSSEQQRDRRLCFQLLLGIGLVMRLKPNIQEITDPDKSFHGESAYMEDMENSSKYAGTAVMMMAKEMSKDKEKESTTAKWSSATKASPAPSAAYPIDATAQDAMEKA